MSTQLINDAGDIVAVAFSGGAKGPMADVHMPRSVAGMVGSMPVFEETSPDLRTTLSMWIRDMEHAGRTVRYEGSLKL
jgi:hypothetical protein